LLLDPRTSTGSAGDVFLAAQPDQDFEPSHALFTNELVDRHDTAIVADIKPEIKAAAGT
jgi:hypothetical protein